MLELRHLQVLRAIAREGSLAAAGRALRYSQPTITHHLTTLESHFGAPLFHRGPRGAALTEVGESLLPHAEAVLERVRLAEQEVRGMVKRGAATLRVGTFPTAGALLLPPAVRRLHQRGVHISLQEGELPTLLAGLRSRELHMALVFSQPGDRLDLEEEFTVHPLLEDPLLLVLPTDHPQAGLDRVPLTALREDGWIMGTTDWDPCDRLLGWACAQEGFEPVHVMEPTTTACCRASWRPASAWPSCRSSGSGTLGTTSRSAPWTGRRWLGRSVWPCSGRPRPAARASCSPNCGWRPSNSEPLRRPGAEGWSRERSACRVAVEGRAGPRVAGQAEPGATPLSAR